MKTWNIHAVSRYYLFVKIGYKLYIFFLIYYMKQVKIIFLQKLSVYLNIYLNLFSRTKQKVVVQFSSTNLQANSRRDLYHVRSTRSNFPISVPLCCQHWYLGPRQRGLAAGVQCPTLSSRTHRNTHTFNTLTSTHYTHTLHTHTHTKAGRTVYLSPWCCDCLLRQ